MTKADFAKQFDFHALSYAKRVEVTFSDGRIKQYDVDNYWELPPSQVDIVECRDLSVNIDADDDMRYPILYVPSPDIQFIHILMKTDKPNHGAHPELFL